MSRYSYKFRREIIAAGGISSTAGLQIGAASTFDAAVTFAAAPIFAAGARLVSSVQALDDDDALSDASTGGTAILGYGITTITVTGATGPGTGGSSANDLTFKLSRPAAVGIMKDIFITGSSESTKVVSIRTANSSDTFFGTTKNSIAFTTKVNDLSIGWSLSLRGITTKKWGIAGGAFSKLSTSVAFAGATA
jgi:hypothetical protein